MGAILHQLGFAGYDGPMPAVRRVPSFPVGLEYVHASIHSCRSADNTRIAFARAGRGPLIVETPTWLTHLELEATNLAAAPWLAELGRGRSVVRYDLRGCGLSQRECDDQCLDAWVADLEAVVDALGLERFPLIGRCQGGAIALAYAARHPERVERLLLYGSFVQGALAQPPERAQVAEVEALATLIETGWGRAVPAFREVFACMLMPTAAPERVRALGELEAQCAGAGTAARLWRAFHRIDVEALAPRVRAPTLVLHARGDGMAPFLEGCRLAALVPEARFVPLDSQNHLLQPDEPAWPQLWQEIDRFLQPRAETPTAAGFAELTGREREVLELLASGLSNPEIAEQLAIRPKTVRNHVTNIFGKLGARHRGDVIVRAREAGFGASGHRALSMPQRV